MHLIVFSDIISTGQDAKSNRGVDIDKVEGALKRIAGVGGISYDPATRSILADYTGPWRDLGKLPITLANNGLFAEIKNPAKVVYRPMVQTEDAAKVIRALKAISGVHFVGNDNNDFQVYVDLELVSLEQIKSACEGVGIRGMIASHEEVRVSFGPGGQGNTSALSEDIARTKWVLNVDIDVSTNAVKVLAIKGRVTKALVKSLMAKHGFPEAK